MTKALRDITQKYALAEPPISIDLEVSPDFMVARMGDDLIEVKPGFGFAMGEINKTVIVGYKDGYEPITPDIRVVDHFLKNWKWFHRTKGRFTSTGLFGQDTFCVLGQLRESHYEIMHATGGSKKIVSDGQLAKAYLKMSASVAMSMNDRVPLGQRQLYRAMKITRDGLAGSGG